MSFKSDVKAEITEAKESLERLENQSFAYEMLKDQRKQNKRMFAIIVITLIMWFLTIGYLVYILNDITVVENSEETTTNEYNQDIDNEGSINDSYIINGGDINGEDKTNCKKNNH